MRRRWEGDAAVREPEGVGPGDGVVAVSHSFIATAKAIRSCGAVPVFVDIDPPTVNMDASQLDAAITPRTRWLMINAPNNPSGALYTREELKAPTDVLVRHRHAAGRRPKQDRSTGHTQAGRQDGVAYRRAGRETACPRYHRLILPAPKAESEASR